MSGLRLLVAARPFDLSDAAGDAFVKRHREMVGYLRSDHDVSIVGLRPAHDSSTFGSDLAELVKGEVGIPTSPSNRSARLATAARRLARTTKSDWEEDLRALAERANPDVVLTIGPWLDVEYRVLFDRWPTVHLFEEDLSKMPEIAPQSPQARLLRFAEDIAMRRSGMRPTIVAVISEAELPAARARFRSTHLTHIPYTLDPVEFPLATTVSLGRSVLVVGNLAQGRNAEGLVEVLEEIERQDLGAALPFRLVSEAGLTDELVRFAERPWVEYVGGTNDLPTMYRTSLATLVPSTRATGFKTTVLQGWIAGCPVVCRPASAQTLGAGSSGAVVVGSDAESVVRQLERLRHGAPERKRLASAGFSLVRTKFSRSEAQARLVEALDSARRLTGRP